MPDAVQQWWVEFRRSQGVYFWHVATLVAPGITLPTLPSFTVEANSLDDWEEDELKLMVDEGRRQVDRQLTDLDRIRLRAQWLFTTGVAATAALGSGLAKADASLALTVVWILGLMLLGWGLAGAAGVSFGKADFKLILTAPLSTTKPPVTKALAEAYTTMLSKGENTIATRLTVLRVSVVFALAGGYLGLVAALLAS